MTETTDTCACNDSNNGCDSDTHYALSFHCPGQYDINFKGNFEEGGKAAGSTNTTDTTDTTDTTPGEQIDTDYYTPPASPSTDFFAAIATTTPDMNNTGGLKGFSAMLVDADENIVVAGNASIATDSGINIFRLEPDGGVLNRTRIRLPESKGLLPYIGLAQGPDNSYLLVAEYNKGLYLLQLDSSLAILQQAHFDFSDISITFKGCASTRTGELIVAAEKIVTESGVYKRRPALFKFDTQFNLVTRKTLEDDRSIEVEGLAAVADDEFILYCINSTHRDNHSVILLRLDAELALDKVSQFTRSNAVESDRSLWPLSIVADDREGYMLLLATQTDDNSGALVRLDADMAIVEKIEQSLPALNRQHSKILALHTGGYMITGSRGMVKYDPELAYENYIHFGTFYPQQLSQDSHGRVLTGGNHGGGGGALTALSDRLALSDGVRINSTAIQHSTLTFSTNLDRLENVDINVVMVSDTMVTHTDPGLTTSTLEYSYNIEQLRD